MKKLLVILLTACLALSLAACGEKKPQTEKQTVTIWHTFTNAQKDYLEAKAAEFNAAHEGEIEVVVVSQEYSGFTDKVYQAVMADVGPDIIFNYASEASKYLADDKVVDLRDYLSADLINSVDAGAREEASSLAVEGMYVMPLVLTGPVLFYNKDILAEAQVEVPTTWDELYEAATKIHAFNGKYGFGFDSKEDGAISMVYQTGAQTYDYNGNTCSFDTPAVRKSLDLWVKGNAEGAYLLNPTDSYMSGDFNSGNLAMYIGSCAGTPYLSGNWDVAPLPQTEGGVDWTPAWDRGIIVFKYNDARSAAACEFVSYFASPEVNAGWCEAMVGLACMSGTREVEAYKNFIAQDTPDIKALNALRPECAGAPHAKSAATHVRKALGNMMADLAVGVSMDEAIKTAYDYVADELEMGQ